MEQDKFSEAARHYDDGDFERAFKLYGQLAGNGSRNAMRAIGWMYFLGEGVQRNLEQAQDWFQRAAELGDAEARWGLGRVFEVHGEKALACAQYEWADKLGFAPAKHSLARMLMADGQSSLAVRMLVENIGKGHLRSMRDYGIYLCRGNEGLIGRIRGAWLLCRFMRVSITKAWKLERGPDRMF